VKPTPNEREEISSSHFFLAPIFFVLPAGSVCCKGSRWHQERKWKIPQLLLDCMDRRKKAARKVVLEGMTCQKSTEFRRTLPNFSALVCSAQFSGRHISQRRTRIGCGWSSIGRWQSSVHNILMNLSGETIALAKKR